MREHDLIFSDRSVLAIDPGLSGAVAVLGGGRVEILRDFKTLQDIERAVLALHDNVDRIVIENVHAMPGQGVVSMFNFGRALGVAESACWAHHPSVAAVSVAPQTWQNHFRKLHNNPRPAEFDARALASEYLPTYASFFCRKKDHNSADAILMAIWFLQTQPA